MKTRISVQERLKDLRVEQGLNLEELAQKTGISKSALGSYENDNDEYKEINHGSLLKLADFYQVSVDALGQLPTGDRAHLHQRAVGALSAGMLGIRGGPRAVPLAGARPRSKVPPAHGRVYARLEAAPREAALRGCPFQRASRHARLRPRTRDPLRSRRDVRDLPACVEMKRDKKARNTTKIVQRWKNDYSFLRSIAKRSIIPTQLLEVT